MANNETESDYALRKSLESKSFYDDWHQEKIDDLYVQPVLNSASKSGTGEIGKPDFIYKNESNKLLILIENKAKNKFHESPDRNRPKIYAVDGIIHYLDSFIPTALLQQNPSIQNYFSDWKIFGIACSGDIDKEYDHEISTFVIDGDEIRDIERKELLDERDYCAYFENIDYENISKGISISSEKINNLLRNLDSQKRPVLLSGLMICLYPDDTEKDFRNQYSGLSIKNIIRQIPTTITDILTNQGIPREKIKVLVNELAFVKTDHDLNNTDVIKEILMDLETKVIPLFGRQTSFDIIGRFYEEFLRYAGITNVKNGVVLTPNHIRSLFTELIDVKTNDVFLDPACGTGGLLISAMLRLEREIQISSLPNKEAKLNEIRQMQLIGFEKNSTMYSLAVSNMLFRGDGKSNIYNEDFFSATADKILDALDLMPTIGLINPPYGGEDNKTNPTKKEIQFVEKLLDRVSRFGIVIAPLSCYIQDTKIRNRILDKHTLKYVIHMPIELFQPNASTATAVAVFETFKPHNNKEVVFYNLVDDGFVTHKVRGRSDIFNRWDGIKSQLLNKLRPQFLVLPAKPNFVSKMPPKLPSPSNLVAKPIAKNDEWLYQAHCDTDYSELSDGLFENTIMEYSIFLAKKRLNLLDETLNELDLLNLFRSNQISEDPVTSNRCRLNQNICREFRLICTKTHSGLFSVRGTFERKIRAEIFPGDYFYVTTSNKNNGISGTSSLYKEVGNVISVDSATEGKAFYQEDKFVGSDHVEIISPIGFEFNRYRAMFIVTMLNFNSFRYGYGRKRAQIRLKKEKILLPIANSEGQVDWNSVEEYIKSLAYSSNLENT